ncbi:hypothetical protein MMC26_002651 [Xylographa opegraphella]|nr:hypothetical protein [Xylographa opegraphella]
MKHSLFPALLSLLSAVYSQTTAAGGQGNNSTYRLGTVPPASTTLIAASRPVSVTINASVVSVLNVTTSVITYAASEVATSTTLRTGGIADSDPQALSVTRTNGALAPAAAGITPLANGAAACAFNVPDMTVRVMNSHSSAWSVFLGANAGGPTAIGNPQPSIIQPAAATQYVFPPCWAGRISFAHEDGQPDASKIEGSNFQSPDLDVSYVDGFTVPISCAAAGGPLDGQSFTGCNVDLFALHTCYHPNPDGSCRNPMNLPPPRDFGPPSPFFAPCAGAAYTFPGDNGANNGDVGTYTMDCCVGRDCPPVPRQPGSNPPRYKRDDALVADAASVAARDPGVGILVRGPAASSHLSAHRHRHRRAARHRAEFVKT